MNKISDFCRQSPLKELARDTLFDFAFLYGTLSLIKPYARESDLPEFQHQAVWFLFTNFMLRGAAKVFQEPAIDLAIMAVAVYHLVLFSPHLFGFLHEYGHKTAADYLCGGKGSIELHLRGASHSYEETPSCNHQLIAAAGPAAEAAAMSCGLVLAHWLNPYAAWALRISVLYKMACLTQYAISAYEEDQDLSHDFYNLWKTAEISPLASGAALLAVPILTQLGMSFARR